MKTKNCIIIGLITVTALLTFVGCSTNLNSTDPAASSLAARKSGGVQTLQLGPGASGGITFTNGSLSCVGTYTGEAKITNSETSSIWFTAPSGTTNCVITDSSGLAAPYLSVVRAVRRSNAQTWCGTNTLSFPALASQQYKFYIYIKNTPPPPTNGQVLTLDVEWNP